MPLKITGAQGPEALLLVVGALWVAVHWLGACCSYACGFTSQPLLKREKKTPYSVPLKRGMESYTRFAENYLRDHGGATRNKPDGEADNHNAGLFTTCDVCSNAMMSK